MVKKTCLRKHGFRNLYRPFPPLKKTNPNLLDFNVSLLIKEKLLNGNLPRVPCINVFILAPVPNRKATPVALLCLLTIVLKQHVKEKFLIWENVNVSVHRRYCSPTWKAYDALQVSTPQGQLIQMKKFTP